MKLIGNLIKLVILVIILALIFHNFAAEKLLEIGLGQYLGAPVSVRETYVDLKQAQVLFQGVTIGNPAGFPREVAADIPEIFLNLKVTPLLEGKIQFSEIEIILKKFQMVRNAAGKINILEFKPLRQRSDSGDRGINAVAFEGGQRDESVYASPKNKMTVQIDKLVLTIKEATFFDLNRPESKEMRFNLGIQQSVYYDIRGAEDILRIIAWETLKKMGFSGVSFLLNGLENSLVKDQGFLSKVVSAIKEKVNQ